LDKKTCVIPEFFGAERKKISGIYAFIIFMTTILGIDPGYGTIGFAIVQKEANKITAQNFGVIETSAEISFQERLCQLAQDFEELLHQYKPSILAIEKLFWGANVDNAIRVAEARGVMEYLAKKSGLEIFEYAPTEVKSKLVGHGKAPKFQVQNILKMRLGLEEIPTPDDAADALGIALICAEEL
jgi:crossover junction endodeoxyribonuclease RuvC